MDGRAPEAECSCCAGVHLEPPRAGSCPAARRKSLTTTGEDITSLPRSCAANNCCATSSTSSASAGRYWPATSRTSKVEATRVLWGGYLGYIDSKNAFQFVNQRGRTLSASRQINASASEVMHRNLSPCSKQFAVLSLCSTGSFNPTTRQSRC